MLNLLITLLVSLAPQHDFHTSWMNMTYNENSKNFDITWRTDTEHLEGVLTAFQKKDIHLDNTTIKEHEKGILSYISANTSLILNKSKQILEIDFIEVNFAETIVHFTPIKCRKKLKMVSMENTLLLAQFPNQKNMVQINYLGKMYSMLLGGTKVYDEVAID